MTKSLEHFGSNADLDDIGPIEAESVVIEVAESIKEGRDETIWENQRVKNTALIQWAVQFLE